jgi:hypothetical protein
VIESSDLELLSVIVPVYNEEEGIREFNRRLMPAPRHDSGRRGAFAICHSQKKVPHRIRPFVLMGMTSGSIVRPAPICRSAASFQTQW